MDVFYLLMSLAQKDRINFDAILHLQHRWGYASHVFFVILDEHVSLV